MRDMEYLTDAETPKCSLCTPLIFPSIAVSVVRVVSIALLESAVGCITVKKKLKQHMSIQLGRLNRRVVHMVGSWVG